MVANIFLRSKLHLRLLFVLFFWSPLFSEEIANALPQAGSNRAFAMGGTYIACNKGINALFGNPAGLSTNNNTEIIIGYFWQVHKISQFDDQYYSGWNDSYSIEYNQNNGLNYLGLSFLRLISQSPIKFAGAIGYCPFYDWNSSRYFNSEDSYIAGMSKTIYSSNEVEEKIVGLYDILTIGIGFSWETLISIGASLNFPVNQQYEYKSHSIYIRKSNGDRQEYEYDYKNSESVSANKFVRIGGILQLTSRFSFGILWMQAHQYSLSEERRDFPATLNFGIAYKILPELLFAFDLQNRPWEKVKIANKYLSYAKSGNTYRFGLEFGKKVIIRAGYALDILPIVDADDNAVDLNDITLGIGYKYNHFVLDMGARYRFSTFEVEEWDSRYDYLIREIVLQSSIKIVI